MSRKRVPDSRKKAFGKNLQAYTAAKKWTQSDLARQVTKFMPKGKEMGRDAISHYWRGVSIPIDFRLLAISRALGVTPQQLDPETEVRGQRFKPAVHIDSEPHTDGIPQTARVYIDLPNVPIKVANKIYALLEGRELW